jgi:hypothetical protein
MGKAAAESAPARSIVGKVPTMARFRNLAAVALIHHSDMNELRTQINNERGLQWSRGTHPPRDPKSRRHKRSPWRFNGAVA